MNLDQETKRFLRIFCPGEVERLDAIRSDGRLVYYTRADTAKSIIGNGEIWFRNAQVMNDFSEIRYGLDLLAEAMSRAVGNRFREAAKRVFPGVIEKAGELLSPDIPDWLSETYLSCWSLHNSSEDQNGRLSMWRAYGDVALVLRNRSFGAFSLDTGIQSLPVNYFSLRKFEEQLERATHGICSNIPSIRKGEEEKFADDLHTFAFLAAIRTKHPAFAEEKEWRVWFRPAAIEDPTAVVLREKVVVIDGVPQKVWALPLRNDPDKGLYDADIGSLLDSIIIGPTAYPYVSYRAFVTLLEAAGVRDARDRVVVSKIPLRARPSARDA